MATKKKEVTDAQAAKKKANPKKDDPQFMPNIEPQTGDGPATKAKAAKRSTGSVRLDPDLPLVHGNTVTFVAPEGDGRVLAKLETPQGVQWIGTSNGQGDARISWIVQVSGDITVGFYNDGDLYAEGTFTVA